MSGRRGYMNSIDNRESPAGFPVRIAQFALAAVAGAALAVAMQYLPGKSSRGKSSPPSRLIEPEAPATPLALKPSQTAEARPAPSRSDQESRGDSRTDSKSESATDSHRTTSESIRHEVGPAKFPGITEPAPGKLARLPFATSQPIAFVDVKVGDRVKKGWQVFSHWESPERLQAVKNELQRTKKQREIAQMRATAADQALARLEKLQGTVAPQELQDATSLAAIRHAEMEAADLLVSEVENRFVAMDFEFKQAFVTSPIDGIVAVADVAPGERRQLGDGFRGVIVLDPSVLQCRCLLTPEQAGVLERMMSSESPKPDDGARPIAVVEADGREWAAHVSSIGVLADTATGLIPVTLEVPNDDEKLRCGIRVEVRFAKPLVRQSLDNDPSKKQNSESTPAESPRSSSVEPESTQP